MTKCTSVGDNIYIYIYSVRRIGDLGANATMSLENDLTFSVAFSIALNEFTDIPDTPQLAEFYAMCQNTLC